MLFVLITGTFLPDPEASWRIGRNILMAQPRIPGGDPDWIPTEPPWLLRNPDRKPGDLRVTVGILALGALVTLLTLTGALVILGLALDAW